MSTSLDGRNIFQWRNAYEDMAAKFCGYAEHMPQCAVRTNKDHAHVPGTLDVRSACEAAPCTCGLLAVLGILLHPSKVTYPCPDAPRPIPLKVQANEVDIYIDPPHVRPTAKDVTIPPHTLWGLPVFEAGDTDTEPPETS